MEMDQRIPDLSDKELEALQANALRLMESGTQKQRQQAEELLPLIGAQLEERRVAKAETQAEKRAAAKKAPKKAKAE